MEIEADEKTSLEAEAQKEDDALDDKVGSEKGSDAERDETEIEASEKGKVDADDEISKDDDEIRKEELAEVEAAVELKAELDAKEKVEEEKRKIEEEAKTEVANKVKAEEEAEEAKRKEADEELRIRSAYLDWCVEFAKTPDKERIKQFKQNYLMLEGAAKEEGKELKLNGYADYTAVEYQFEMQEKEEAKKKEQEERLKIEQEEAEAAFVAAGGEIDPDPSTEETDGIKLDAAQEEDEDGELFTVSEDRGEAPKTDGTTEELGEWWKQEAGLDESLLKTEDRNFPGMKEGGKSDYMKGKSNKRAATKEQKFDADDPEVRKRVRTAYSGWCKMYKKEPDEARFPKFKSNYLIMEKLAIQQGREVFLNEFADCTPDEYEKASRSKPVAFRPTNKQPTQKVTRIEKKLNPPRVPAKPEPELVRAKTTIYVSRETDDTGVDQAAVIAEVERIAMAKAEEAARRVAQTRLQKLKQGGAEMIQKMKQGSAEMARKISGEERINREREAAKSEFEKRRANTEAEEVAKRLEQVRIQKNLAEERMKREREAAKSELEKRRAKAEADEVANREEQEERIQREREAAKSELEKRREEALRIEAERDASAKADAKIAEENQFRQQFPPRTESTNPFIEKQRLRREREEANEEAESEEDRNSYEAQQREGRRPAFIPKDMSKPRGSDETSGIPEIDSEETQPVVKPPTVKAPNPFQRRPTFTSPPKGSNVSESEDSGFDGYSPTSWQDQSAEETFDANGNLSSESDFENINGHSDQIDGSDSRDQMDTPQNGSGYQIQFSPPMTENVNDSTSLDAEESSNESFNNLPSFVDNSQDTTSNPNSSTEKSEADSVSNYDGSYFMNMPRNSDEAPQSFDYIQNWANSNQDLSKQTDVAPDDPSVGNDISDTSGTWYDGNGTPASSNEPSTNPFTGRSTLMNKGASYLENLSQSDSSSSSDGVNAAVSSAGSAARQELSQQQGSSQPGSTFPERIKAAYRDWCQYYGKEYNESRLATFSSNFLAVERYHRETGVSLILNELADMTSEEFQQNRN